MKRIFFSSCFAVVAAVAAGQEPVVEPGVTPEKKEVGETVAERIASTEAILERYGHSIAQVAWFFKPEADGTQPSVYIPYYCPIHGSLHSDDVESLMNRKLPFIVPGFFTAPDTLVCQDPLLFSNWIDHIEVRFDGKKTPVAIDAIAPSQNALFLKTSEPVDGAVPLAFEEKEFPSDPTFFYLVKDSGLTYSGIQKLDGFGTRRCLEVGKMSQRVPANTIVLGDEDEPLSVCVDYFADLLSGSLTPPTKWERQPADTHDRFRTELVEKLSRGVLPVFLQLEPLPESSRRRYSDESSSSYERYVCGIVLKDGRVFVSEELSPSETARLVKMEAVLPDGTKAPLKFVSSLADWCAIIASFEDEVVPDGITPLEINGDDIISLFGENIVQVSLRNERSAITPTFSMQRVLAFEEERGERLVPDLTRRGRVEAQSLLLDSDGAIRSVALKQRNLEKWDSLEQVCGSLLLEVTDPEVKTDPENIPREGRDRIRTAWLGVEPQTLTKEVAIEKKAMTVLQGRVFDWGGSGALVGHVFPDSPADKLGIEEGDVLVGFRLPSEQTRRFFDNSGDESSQIDWAMLWEQAPLSVYEDIPFTPWPNVENNVNKALTEIGIGKTVILTWVHDGDLKGAEISIEQAPPYWASAKRARSRAIGTVVADATFEVREYYDLKDDDPGVVVVKIKDGSPAAVAGLRPFELVTQIGDKPIYSAKEFAETIAETEDIVLSVRRLNTTRVMRLKSKQEEK